ncbi:MAG: acyl-CoA carboxylase subunit epsilon [Streptosporangiaceae bacterium]
MAPSVNDDRPAGRPYLRVVRGDATPEEVAALVAVLMARSAEAEAAPAASSRSAWSDRSRRLRGLLSPGPGAWRRSALPM